MGDNVVAGRPIYESAWKRGYRDAWELLRNPYLSVGYTILTSVIAVLSAAVVDVVIQIAAPLFALTILVGGLIAVFAFFVCRAPFVQRKEARREIDRLLTQREPKLVVRNPKVQLRPPPVHNPLSMPEGATIAVHNDSDSIAEECEARLLEVKPFMEWTDLHEGNRIAYGSNAFSECPDIPVPAPLRWPAQSGGKETPSVKIPPRGDELLDVCYSEGNLEGGGDDKLFVAFASDEMSTKYALPEADIVLLVRLDSKGGIPVYCVCKYRPNPPMAEIEDQWVVNYFGPELPDMDEYRCFKETPRPPHWS